MLCLMDFTLGYMDLALTRVEKKIVKIEQFSHKCYFLKPFKHNLHGENMQLNSLVDLVISLGFYLENQGIHNTKNLGNLMIDFDYIKTQDKDILIFRLN